MSELPFVMARYGRGGSFAAAPAAGATSSGESFENTKSVQFDGVDEEVSCGDMAALTAHDEITVSLWFYMTAAGDIAFGSGDNAGSGIFVQQAGTKMYFGVGGAYLTTGSGTRPSEDAWHHFCGVFDPSIGGQRGVVYIDGAAVAFTGTMPTASGAKAGENIYIGAYAIGTSHFWAGKLDEVAIWDSALSAAQVTNIYKGEENGGSGGTNGTTGDLASFSPLGWWRMGDGDTFATLTNHGSTGATNNGTMVNMESGDIVEDVP